MAFIRTHSHGLSQNKHKALQGQKRAPHYAAQFARTARNKRRRIAQRNGEAAAAAWAPRRMR